MAKGNLLLGMGRGKLGDIVLYRQNGQQMSRPRTRVVKNPRTSGQQIQRMIQATIAYGYAGLKTIVDHSFEGVQYGQRSMSYFMKRNMDALRSKVITGGNGEKIQASFALPNIRTLYLNEYIVSNGSLSPCPDPFFTTERNPTYGLWFAESVLADLKVSTIISFFGADPGDQLTFLMINHAFSGEIIADYNGEKLASKALAVRRLKLKDSYTETELNTAVTSENLKTLFDPDVTSDDFFFTNDGENDHGYGFGVRVPSLEQSDRKIVGGCVIKSRKNGNSWLRSPQTMVCENLSESYTKGNGFSLSTAYNAWLSGTTPVGVSDYLLNGKPNTDIWPTVPDEGSNDENP